MNNLVRILLLFSLIFWFEKAALAQKKKVIGIQKTACYGACPVFTMDILSNCKVILHAEQFLEIGKGEFKSKLSKSEFDELLDDFRSAGFFELDDSYRSNASDLPTTYFYFKDLDRSKSIEVYGNWPDELTKLDQKIDRLIRVLEWKKVRSSKNDSNN